MYVPKTPKVTRRSGRTSENRRFAIRAWFSSAAHNAHQLHTGIFNIKGVRILDFNVRLRDNNHVSGLAG